MAKVTADWLDLSVKAYDDGTYEAYEALQGDRYEGNWPQVRRWIERLLDTTETEITQEKERGA